MVEHTLGASWPFGSQLPNGPHPITTTPTSAGERRPGSTSTSPVGTPHAQGYTPGATTSPPNTGTTAVMNAPTTTISTTVAGADQGQAVDDGKGVGL